MRIGAFVSTAGGPPLERLLARFRAVEERGLHTAWVGQVFEHEALTLLALAGRETGRVELGSWVVPLQPRHPSALAQQALTAQLACGGRLLLGVGVSHRAVIEGRLGLDYARPAAYAREYLDALGPLLAGAYAVVSGERISVRVALSVAGAAPPPVFLAALGPAMLRLAGARSDGVAIWLGGPRYLEHFALPRIRAGAKAAGRPPPRVACGLPVLATADPAAGRDAVDALLATSARLPVYQRVLEREGATRPADVALVGDAVELEARLARLAELGVSDFNAIPVTVDGDPAATARTLDALGALAPRLA